MFKRILVVAFFAVLLTPYAAAQSRSLMPKDEQPEDMLYYQPYKWDTPVERKVLYESIANGQFHMFDKMMNCQTEVYSNLEDWLDAFKVGADEVVTLEIERQMRDMDDNILRYPDDGQDVATWLTRDYAEKHYGHYTGDNLDKIKEKFWYFCLEKLPVELFTKEAKQRVEAQIQAEIEREASYP
jgi:hypothetical protein